MNIEEHNYKALYAAFQLGIEHGIVAEDAELKAVDTDHPRFKDIHDKPGKTSGYLKILSDEEGKTHRIYIRSNRPGLGEAMWNSHGLNSLSSVDRQERINELETLRTQKMLKKEAFFVENRIELAKHITSLSEVSRHPYLSRKNVSGNGLLMDGDALIIPISNYKGNFINAQRILPNGTKYFYKDCGKKGACHVIQGNDSTLLVAEGYATAASCFDATGYTSIMAIDCGNIYPVVESIRSQTKVPIVIIADNDKYKEKNAGVEAAEKVAKEFEGISIFIPEFQDETSQPTDANDLMLLEGMDELKRQLKPVIAHARMGIPPSFFFSNGWLCQKRESVSAKVSTAIYPVALSRDKASEDWGLVLQFADMDGHTHQFALPRAALIKEPSLMLEPLVSRGLHYDPGELRALQSYINTVQPVGRARSVSQTGWFGDVYVLPDEAIGASSETVIYQSFSGAPPGYEQSGSLEDWQKNVATKCVGNSRLVLMVAAGFAGPLLELDSSLESGGFHIRSESSRGKSTGLRVCKSLWGAPDKLVTWRATSNGLEGVCFAHNDATLVIDELGQMADENPAEAAQTVYMVANGSSKARANRTGGAAAIKTWRLIFMSAGEVSLSNLMEQHGKKVKAGQEVRFIDIPADAGKGLGLFEELHDCADGASFAEALNRDSKRFYGTAARAFLRLLTADKAGFTSRLKKLMAEFLVHVPDGADGQIKRAANRFALVAAAGELASDITGWPEGESLRGVKACFDSWLAGRGEGSHESNQAIESVKAQLLTWGDSRFGQAANGPVWGAKDGSDFLVYPAAFKSELCRGLEHRNVAKILYDNGYLPSTASVTKRIHGVGTRKVYVISGKLLGDEPEPPPQAQSDDSPYAV
ncbi:MULTISPECIES: TOPRIM and DUF927 domain-containing protein [Dickeya]|uniref:DUF927 domain-containing protein n=1 Tax=Dickeya lacustris TaxID=2259638 RepID=A0ABY8G5J9_9GAMM|nr:MULTISPECIES: DUF927 domain-containing protein [Dickeya]WFN55200.1 DUF927 domain-containing protein [Dickeya lacustris]WJM86490.1 DUF927 domain-containing protein [Dickeya chrysanthemi]